MSKVEQHRDAAQRSQGHTPPETVIRTQVQQAGYGAHHCATPSGHTESPEGASLLPNPQSERVLEVGQGLRRSVPRGLSASIPATALQALIAERALLLADRFRVIRTIDVAVACFAERPFKAALTAAQRAMRGLVNAQLLRRYRTDRFQTVYGLTQKGADWLAERGHEAASSVRRVSDMSNPEHRLWAQFLVLASEARGLSALTEQELLQELNRGKVGASMVQGLLKVNTTPAGRETWMHLRPDAVFREQRRGDEVATTWFEVDRSKRGANREAALAALAMRMGARLEDGTQLRTIAVFARTERIEQRALAVIRKLAMTQGELVLTEGRRHFGEVEPGIFAVTANIGTRAAGRQVAMEDVVVGHIVVQRLPTWLPKARIEAGTPANMAGWFEENFLPYRRADALPSWCMPRPLMWTHGRRRPDTRRITSIRKS